MIVVGLIFALVLTFYFWSRRKYNYWSKRRVVHPKPTTFFGNYGDHLRLRLSMANQIQGILKDYVDESYVGAYFGTEPVLIVQDPELIKLILAKDFYYFNSREVMDHTHKEILTNNMFFTFGDNWRVMRQNLTPLFSSAKMRNMFHLIDKRSFELEKLIDEELSQSEILEAKQLMTRFTMDCICACVLGIDTRAMGKDIDNNPFRHMGDTLFDWGVIRSYKTIARSLWPDLFYLLRQQMWPPEIHKFFSKILLNVFEQRGGKPGPRQDFVDLVLNLRNNNPIVGDSIKNMKDHGHEKVEIKVDDDLLVAQCVLFFAAGFETSSTTSTFTLYELAKNPEAQEKALAEVDRYLSTRNRIHYDVTTELPYLEQCIDETLRLYPVIPTSYREVYEDYVLPDGLKLERGLRIHIPVYHLQRNPKYFPDPEEYKPERFSPEGRKNIRNYTYIPWGEGPRICLGKSACFVILS